MTGGMKILITGGSGFIGTNLVDYYRQKGWEVMNVDVREPKNKEARSCWTQCDITDLVALEGVVQALSFRKASLWAGSRRSGTSTGAPPLRQDR